MRATQGRRKALWPHAANLMLGAWLLSSPAALGYRSISLTWSDLLSGAFLIVLTVLALSKRWEWLSWVIAAIGLWLMSAPLLFWAPTAAAYNNDTLVGALVVAFAILVPKTNRAAGHASDIPFGWSYNPSSWSERAPIVALALVGFFIARYMAAFQLGHINTIWEPFFGNGTEQVLRSDVSKAFPVSDAGLGALSYLIDALAGLVGDRRRWRTMPWMVIVFGIFIIPPGVVSIVLIMLQPIAVGSWCTLCLLASVVMLLMVAPAVDEVIATGQFLLQCRRNEKDFWNTLWRGGDIEDERDESSPESANAETEMTWSQLISGVVLFSTPWNLLLSAILGIRLMAAPALLGMQGLAANSDYIVGSLVVTFAIIAGAEPVRSVRWLNILLGAWLLVMPWLIAGSTSVIIVSHLLTALALILLSLPRGGVRGRYGSWDVLIR